jgi:hypothetical protein
VVRVGCKDGARADWSELRESHGHDLVRRWIIVAVVIRSPQRERTSKRFQVDSATTAAAVVNHQTCVTVKDAVPQRVPGASGVAGHEHAVKT